MKTICKSILILLFFTNIIPCELTSQVLQNTIYGEFRNNYFGSKIKSSEDGLRFAVKSQESLENDIFHEYVTIYKNENGVISQLGDKIDCSLNFTETIDRGYVFFDLSADGEVLMIWYNDKYFHYEFKNNEWEIIHEMAIYLNPTSIRARFSLSGDGRTLCILNSNGSNAFIGYYEILTYKYINEKWVRQDFELIQDFDSTGPVELSHDGNSLIHSDSSPEGNAEYHQVKVYDWLNNQWTKKGNDLLLETSWNGGQFGLLINYDFAKDAKSIVIGGIGDDTSFFMNSSSVRVYEYLNQNWVQKGQEVFGYHDGDAFGVEVDFSNDGSRYIVSAPFIDELGFSLEGVVKIYDYSDTEWTLYDTIAGIEPFDLCGFSFAMTGDGNTLILGCAGYSESYSQQGKVDVYSLDGSTAISEGSSLNANPYIYPNPTNGIIQIKNIKAGELKLFNQIGLEVFSQSILPADISASKSLELDLGALNAGVYFLQIEEGPTQKLVIVAN